MLQITRKEIITLYEQGGFLAKYAPMHDWYRYLPDYKPLYESGGSLAKMIEPEIPQQMKEDGELEIAYRDGFAKMYIYKLGERIE